MIAVGVSCERFPCAEPGAEATLRAAAAEGLDGVAFPTPYAVSATLEPAELDRARDLAQQLELYLEVGIGAVATAAGPIHTAEARRRLEACLQLGSTEVTAYTTLNRFDREASLDDQLMAVAGLLGSLAPRAREAGIHLNVETHEDLTSADVLRLVRTVGEEISGINLDLANAVVRGEHPVHVVEELAPYVRQTQLEDVTLGLTRQGLRRFLAPCGAGVVAWEQVLPVLLEGEHVPNLSVEQHHGQFDLDLFDPTWVGAHPDLSAAAALALVGEVVKSAPRDSAGVPFAPEPQARDEPQLLVDLRLSVDHLRAVARDKHGAMESPVQH